MSSPFVEITIHRGIQIHGLPGEYIRKIMERLRIKNPQYEKARKMKCWIYSEARQYYHFFFYDNARDVLYLPRGVKTRLASFLIRSGIKAEWEDKTLSEAQCEQVASFEGLMDYQKDAASAANNARNGIIQLGTGRGKTICALEISRRLGLQTLILVPTLSILKQFEEEAKRRYGYSPGICGGGRKETSRDITIATFQIIQRDEALRTTLAKKISVLIVDECQMCASPRRFRLFFDFAPRHLYGLTATPERSKDDGRTPAIQWIFGPVLYQSGEPHLTPVIEVIETNFRILLGDTYAASVKNLIECKERNTLICDLTKQERKKDRKILILTKRIEHARFLTNMLSEQKAYFADASVKHTHAYLAELRQTSDFTILIGTTSLLSVGIDIPALDTLIIAGDVKSNVLLKQSAGRILRLFEGKPKPKIIDIADMNHPMFRKQFYERKRVYEEKKWLVV